MNAPRTLYIGAVQIVTATIIKWLCNTATVRIRFSWSWYRPKFLCLTLCVTFSTHITISLSTLRSIPSNLAEPQISSSSCSELKKLICIPKFNQPSIPLQTPPSSAPITPAMSPIPQDISDIHVLLLLKMQPWSLWWTIMDIILVTTCQNLRMMSWGIVWESKNMMKLSQPKRLVLRLRLFSAH